MAASGRNRELIGFALATYESAVHAFDTGLQAQLRDKDDATLAVWSSIGLEGVTLAAVLFADPPAAFLGRAVPSDEEIRDRSFKTALFTQLAQRAATVWPTHSYPADAERFMREVRNKIMHTGGTAHVGLVGPTLRVAVGVSRWLSGVGLPKGPLRHEPRMLPADRLEAVPSALSTAARRVAQDNVEHLRTSLTDGHWDDTPHLKAIAEREMADCQRILGMDTSQSA